LVGSVERERHFSYYVIGTPLENGMSICSMAGLWTSGLLESIWFAILILMKAFFSDFVLSEPNTSLMHATYDISSAYTSALALMLWSHLF
jgi:hypothetical protein